MKKNSKIFFLIVISFFLVFGFFPRTSKAASITIHIAATADDGTEQNGGWMTNYGSGYDDLGSGGGTASNVGWRFTGLNVSGTITSAYITVKEGNYDSPGTVASTIYAWKTANAGQFSGSNRPSTVSKTTASVPWSFSNDAQLGNTFNTPDISSVIQEIVNSYGLSNGTINIFALGTANGDVDALLEDYQNAGTAEAVLTVTYTPGITDTQAPTVPTNLSATAASQSQINLSWAASTDNVSVTGYTIYRNGSQIGTSATNSYSDSGLTASTQYTYTIDAYDAAGNHSAQSTAASATTQTPANQAPIISSFTANPASIAAGNSTVLSWSVSGTPPPTLSINNGVGAVVGLSVNVSPATTTTYTLTATNSQGSANANTTVTVIPLDTTPPAVPAGLSATAVSASQINLSWTASTDNVGIAGYKVFRGGSQIGTSATNSYTDTGLTASTQYTYTVSAYDVAGNNSSQSASASATTQVQQVGSYPWSGIIDSSRAIDWSSAGFTIPNYTTNCAVQPALQTGNSHAGANTTAIQNALASCDATHNVVNLPAGTYYVAGINFPDHGHQVLRGAGASQTTLILTNAASCGGDGGAICMSNSNVTYAGNDAVLPPGGTQQCSWTGTNGVIGTYTQGAISIILSGCGGTPPLNSMIILDQANDGATDNHGVYICDNNISICTYNGGGGGNNNGRFFGGATHSQQQVAYVTAVSGSGSGPYTVTISSGVYFTNIRSSQSPGAWWSAFAANDGIENLKIDNTSNPGGSGVDMYGCYECWVTGVTSIKGPRSHVHIYLSANDVVRNNYFYQAQTSGSDSYGVEIEVSSAFLVENNIFQQTTAPIMFGAGTGAVVGYNFTIDNQFGNQYLNPMYDGHNAGNEMNLYEGNSTQGIWTDNGWGSSDQQTDFRNMEIGWAIGRINSTFPVMDRAFTRNFNFVGNVLGQPGYHNNYQSYATSRTAGVNGPLENTSIYSLGWGDGGDDCSSYGTVCDPLTYTTTMRWGNYDTVTNGVKWDSTEASPAAVPYVNANFTSSYFSSLAHTLPASFYYSSRPSWWPSNKPWPPVGPDVSSGNVGTCSGTYSGAQATNSSQCPGGTLTSAWAAHVNSIPAQDCYLSVMQGPPDGSGGVLPFDASTCYTSSGTGSDTTPPSTPTGLNAIAISSSAINLTWTASTDNVGVTGYKIFRNGSQIGTSASNSYSDTGLTAGTLYSYTVSAYDAASNNSSQSSSSSATTTSAPDTTAPTIPTNLTATVASSTQVNLSWTASTDPTVNGQITSGLAGYKIFRNGSQVAITATNSYSDTNLFSSTSYTYTVLAYDNANNSSAQSSSSSATTPTGTPLPGDFNLDHIVNALDYSIMNSHWLQNYPTADIVVDGLINSLDFAVLKSNWGKTW